MATDVLKLRVILDEVNAERVILPSRPETVQALISEMKDKLNLTYDFRLQFEDPEFDNALNNLVNMEDLPAKATVKLYSEFHRITNLNLPSTFYASLDKYTPQLLQLYKKRKTGPFGQKLEAIMMAFEEQDDSEADQEGTVALVAVVNEEEVLQVPFETQHVSIVLEDMVVMSHRSWTDSLVILFALVYALHLKYPEKLSGFFEFIQVILLDLDDGRKQLRPKLQALKNELE
ncbi:hypothetical protein JZ751_008405 [Albula glossodonta]|uniref:Uncharacterized protein n=1 Tax=Albula glossodonta TaxID=121402 RepID=A0A8T2MKV1_9TELE|nr:hypothetical protein JZ751_008405 [Albula glossodonta]